MSNDGRVTELLNWASLILLVFVKGIFLASIVIVAWVIDEYFIKPLLPEAGLTKYLIHALKLLFAVATLWAVFKLLFLPNGLEKSKSIAKNHPWWSGR